MSQSINQTQLGESLSALADNEASELEVRRLLAESEQDAGLRECWHRYQLARSVMKDEMVEISTEFADRIRDAVAHMELEQTTSNPGEQRRQTLFSRWKFNSGKVAIAASVAAAVLIGSQQMNLVSFNSGDSEEFARQQAEPMPTAPSAINVPTINVQNVSGGDAILPRSRLPQGLQYSPNVQQQQLQDEQIRRYIRQLMLEHAEHSAQNSGSGLLPYARVPAEEE